MLQALKNLEARSPRPALGGVLSHLQEQPAAPQDAEPPVPEERPLAKAPLPVFVQAPTVTCESPARGRESLSPIDDPHREVAGDIDSRPPFAAASSPAADRRSQLVGNRGSRPIRHSAPRFASGRTPTPLERSVRRTLSDPSRSQPLEDLAAHLARDIEQTGSKTVLWVALGTSSGTHESLLQAAAILAARQTGQTLLIDADLARRPLSLGIECGEEPGLAELVTGDQPARARSRPTAFERLSVLPAGLKRHVDLSAAGARLEELLQELAAEHALVLICGGSSSELSSSALARLADATYFVVQLGAVEANEAQSALRDFRAAGARVLGCIAT